MKDIIKSIISYPETHSLRELVEKGLDKDYRPRIPEGVLAFNIMQPLIMVLQRLKVISLKAYEAFITDKLVARNGNDGVDSHNLISALCELSVMNAFIAASEQPESFFYEPRLIERSKKNVEFSIIVGGLLYEVEVKSANMINHAEALDKNMRKEGQVIEPNSRMIPVEEWKAIAGETPLMLSLDNKVADFLSSAQEKFPPIENSIHLLVICWDGRYRKALTALKSETSGLMTANTYRPDLGYDHISHIVVTSQYGFVINWLQGGLPPVYAQDPLNLRFAYNFLMDYNLDKPDDIHERLVGIFGCQELPVVDEKYVDRYCEDAAFTINLPLRNRLSRD